jgi:hypothetical protein
MAMWGPFRRSPQPKRRRPRRAERRLTNALECDLGRIVDISRTGARVRLRGKPPLKLGQVIALNVQSEQQRIRVQAMAVWIKRRGLRLWEMGLQFVNTNVSVASALEAMAAFGFVDLEAAARRRGGAEAPASVRMSAEIPDYYEILGITRSATEREIRAAYREMARKYHPDVSDDPQSAQVFMQITEAYDVLRDAGSRRSYDLRLQVA